MSAKMFPLLCGHASKRVCGFFLFWFFILVLAFSIVPPLLPQPSLDQLDLPGRRGNTFRGFLLKDVQNIDSVLKTNRVDGSPRIAVVEPQFRTPLAPPKSFERLGGRISLALLGG